MTQAIFQQATVTKQAAAPSGLPDRKYFKIGEVSSLLGVKPHVLRYWESEFPQIRPYKSRTGQRLYRKRDVEALQHIQRLLYQERYTIAGARQALRMMYENDSPILEEVLSEEAIEAAVAVDLPVVEAKTMDVLEVVEEKLNQSEMALHLKNARLCLRELLLAANPEHARTVPSNP